MQKYNGDPATEAEHIKQGMLRGKLDAAHNKLALVSGQADQGIQAMQKINAPKTSGKYWGSNVALPDMNQVGDILDRHVHNLRQQAGIPIADQMQQMFNSGEFAVARKRQADAFNVAMSNVNAQNQEDAMISGKTMPVGQPIQPVVPLGLKTTPGTVGAGTYEQRNLDAVRRAQDAVDRKLGIGVTKGPVAGETEDQIARRLGLK